MVAVNRRRKTKIETRLAGHDYGRFCRIFCAVGGITKTVFRDLGVI